MATDYIICIPSYKRAEYCKNKTLATLAENGINKNKIYVYVANKSEFDLYSQTLDSSTYNKIVIGRKGLVQQRQFIINKWPTGKNIVFFDDDIEQIDLSLSDLFKRHNLDYFIKHAFEKCLSENAYIWGVYPVFNPYFRGPKPEMSTDLKYIVGAFYGIINRPNMNSIQITITKENGQKEDVERSIKYFIQDGIVLRFNKVGFVTKYYGKEGGLGTFESRLKPMENAAKKLYAKYPEYGRLKIKKNGMYEFALKKIHAHTKTNNKTTKTKNNKTTKTKNNKTTKTRNNKTRKNKNNNKTRKNNK